MTVSHSPRLKVLFVTQDDPFYLPVFFRELGRILDPVRVRVCGVVIQKPLGRRTMWSLVRQMREFYGSLNFLHVGFRYVLYRVLGVIAVRVFHGKFPGAFSVKHVLLENGWPVVPGIDVNSDGFQKSVRGMNIDLLVSAAASQIFKDAALSLPRYGCINVHTAKLPKNRGMMPNFWSLYQWDVDPVSAVTVHKMNASLDDGGILVQEEFRLDPKESLHRLTLRTKVLGARVVAQAIAMYHNGEPEARPNSRAEATYNSFPTKVDVGRFTAKGLKLL